MKPFKTQQFEDYFYIFLGGFLGFLIALFFLHFVHVVAVGKFSATEAKIDLVFFFLETLERQVEGLGILFAFSLAGTVLGVAGVLRQRIQRGKKKIKSLEEISQAKTEFISVASHQLRAPLTGIKWIFKMMLEGDFGKLIPQQREVLLRGLGTNERLIRLVGELLDISRIEQQRFEIHLKSITLSQLRQIVEKVIAELKERAKEKNISLRFDPASLLENKILADPDKITQIIQNLLENAINYTPQNGNIHVRVEQRNNALLVHVSDTGIGIPKAVQKEIFTKFFRAQNARKIRSGGTGLGLYLCKTLIEMQEGKIWFASRKGKGTTFSFRLPLQGIVPAKEFLRRL